MGQLVTCRSSAGQYLAYVTILFSHGSRADTGHYTADVFNPGSKRWTSFNDNRVRTIREKTVKGRTKLCYLLFYMRKEISRQLMQDTG